MSTHDVTKTCEFCGRELAAAELPHETAEMAASLGIGFVPVFEPCPCEGAAAERERREAEEAREAARAALEELRAACDLMGIPPIYRAAALDADQEPLLDAVREGRGLFLTGRPGRGKTHAACAILLRLHEEGWRNLKFCDLERVEREVRDTWGERGESEARVIARYTHASCLVIDDLGCEQMTPNVTRVMRAVIAGRESAGRPTVFTSNFDRAGFAERLKGACDPVMAERMASRIKGMTEVVPFGGPDRRLGRGVRG